MNNNIYTKKGGVMLKRKAQSVTEYAILLGVAIAIFAGMQTVVKRGISAKIKSAADTVTDAGADMVIDIGASGTDASGQSYNTTFNRQNQYEAYNSYAQSDSYSENIMQEHTGGGELQKEIVSQMNIQNEGSIRLELAGKEHNDKANNTWD